MLARSLNLFLEHPALTEVIAVIPPGEEKAVRELLQRHCPLDKLKFTGGGSTRQESVSRGLEALSVEAELVCIHDAARPLASAGLIDSLLKAAARWGAAIPAIALSDTIKKVDQQGFVQSTPGREGLRLAQTPQVFRRDIIVQAYRQANQNRVIATDDASLVELFGKPVMTIPGEHINLKITSSSDLIYASLLLKGVGSR